MSVFDVSCYLVKAQNTRFNTRNSRFKLETRHLIEHNTRHVDCVNFCSHLPAYPCNS